MKGKRHSLLLALALGSSFAAAKARAAPLSVYLTGDGSESDESLERLRAELRSDGYLVEDNPRGVAPCAGRDNASPATVESAWIFVRFEAERARTRATICYSALGTLPQETSLSAPSGESRRLSIATVEALNGLRARPRPIQSQNQSSAAKPPAVAERARATGAIFAQAAMTVEALGGRPLIGAALGLNALTHGPLSFEFDALVPLRPAEHSGRQRELSLRAAWARLGPRLSWTYSPISLGVSLQAGAAMIWASARTTPPLIGSTDATGAAIVSTGLWLECPDASSLYFRAGGHVSRLFPSVDLALGGAETQPFGQVLLDTSIGFGVRWGRAR